MNTKHVLSLALVATALGGCVSNPLFEEPGDAKFGEANRMTMMAQVVDPDPEYETLVPESSGEHSSAAIKRYREGNVKEPRRQGVTSGSGGGGS